MFHPPGPGPGHGNGGTNFKELLRRVAEQYEQDLAQALGAGGFALQQAPLLHQPESEEFHKLPPGVQLPGAVTETRDSDGVNLHGMEWLKQPVQPPSNELELLGDCTDEDGKALPATPRYDDPVKQPDGEAPAILQVTHHPERIGPRPRGSLFCQIAMTQERLKEQMSASQANIKRKLARVDTFEERGGLAKFVQSPTFDRLSAVLLLLNAIFIGVQVECSFQPETPLAVLVVDYIFCVAFLVELTMRIWGLGCGAFFCHPQDRAWNNFDFFIVTTSTVDTVTSSLGQGEDPVLGNIGVLRIVRVVRIVRVLRIIRVMKFFQDLRILLAAIISTIKTASFALILILLIMYMFGIAITQLVAEYATDKRNAGTPLASNSDTMEFFGSIGWSILTMFMTISGGIDWRDAAIPLFDVGVLAVMFFLCYVALMVLCVMNVLLGIFCQCALDTAATDKENVITLQMQEKERFVKTLRSLFNGWDDSGDGVCTIQEFEKHIQDEKTQALLRSLGIEGRDALTLFGLLDTDGSGEIDLEEFVTGCITLRGGAKAVHMEKLNQLSKTFSVHIGRIETTLSAIELKLAAEHRLTPLIAPAAKPAAAMGRLSL